MWDDQWEEYDSAKNLSVRVLGLPFLCLFSLGRYLWWNSWLILCPFLFRSPAYYTFDCCRRPFSFDWVSWSTFASSCCTYAMPVLYGAFQAFATSFVVVASSCIAISVPTLVAAVMPRSNKRARRGASWCILYPFTWMYKLEKVSFHCHCFLDRHEQLL